MLTHYRLPSHLSQHLLGATSFLLFSVSTYSALTQCCFFSIVLPLLGAQPYSALFLSIVFHLLGILLLA